MKIEWWYLYMIIGLCLNIFGMMIILIMQSIGFDSVGVNDTKFYVNDTYYSSVIYLSVFV